MTSPAARRGQGGFELTSAADAVKVEVLAPAGACSTRINLGAQAAAGMHSFNWPSGTATSDSGLTFRVSATTGGVATPVTALMRDRVDAISTTATGFNLELDSSGTVPYSAVKAFNWTLPTARVHRKDTSMSFQQGLSGLNASSKSLEVIGNNIANANTYGAKASRAEFADMYASALTGGGGANNIGIGTTLAAVAQQFTQGNITATGSSMDLAINGNGFFQVSHGGPTQYSRNGQFQVDRDGYLTNDQQMKLMGYPADAYGVVQPGQAKPLQLPTSGIAPQATSTKIEMEFNLDSRAATTLPAAGAADRLRRPDHLQQRDLADRLRRQGPGRRADLLFPEGVDRHLERLRRRERHADRDRRRQSGAVDDDHLSRQRRHADLAAGHRAVRRSRHDERRRRNDAADPRRRSTSPARPSTARSFGVTNMTQDGYAPGQLTSVSIEKEGIVMATYSNGQSKPAGQIELSTFRNPQGLQPLGGNLWARTYESGDPPFVGVPGAGNMGSLQSGALEESNVDLTGELVNMITAQRVYQANAQTIKTQDQVLQTLVNLR